MIDRSIAHQPLSSSGIVDRSEPYYVLKQSPPGRIVLIPNWCAHHLRLYNLPSTDINESETDARPMLMSRIGFHNYLQLRTNGLVSKGGEMGTLPKLCSTLLLRIILFGSRSPSSSSHSLWRRHRASHMAKEAMEDKDGDE
jgi:hypothetical protein